MWPPSTSVVMHKSALKRKTSRLLTALLDGLVAPVGTVAGLVAHLAHLDALSTPTLELVWAIALGHCTEGAATGTISIVIIYYLCFMTYNSGVNSQSTIQFFITLTNYLYTLKTNFI